MIREFPEQGMAVIIDQNNNEVLRQLVQFKKGYKGRTVFTQPELVLTYQYKKDAINACRKMGFPLDHVVCGENIIGQFWFIQYDFRYNYAIACWEA